jgi:hypothetical protein
VPMRALHSPLLRKMPPKMPPAGVAPMNPVPQLNPQDVGAVMLMMQQVGRAQAQAHQQQQNLLAQGIGAPLLVVPRGPPSGLTQPCAVLTAFRLYAPVLPARGGMPGGGITARTIGCTRTATECPIRCTTRCPARAPLGVPPPPAGGTPLAEVQQ